MGLKHIASVGIVLAMSAGCAPSRDYHGYIVDEIHPNQIEVGVDTRSTVMAKLGSPSVSGMFNPGEEITKDANDDASWVYITYRRARLAYFKPEVESRTITRITFDDADAVASVEEFDLADGQEVAFSSRETPTRGRELGILEQIFGTVGRVVLPTESENPTDPRR